MTKLMLFQQTSKAQQCYGRIKTWHQHRIAKNELALKVTIENKHGKHIAWYCTICGNALMPL